MPPVPPSDPEYNIHDGEGVYTRLGECLDIPSVTLSALGNSAIRAKELAYCKSLSYLRLSIDFVCF